MPIGLGDSPILKSFEGLRVGDYVYSKRYGLGYVHRFYNDEVIIRFYNQRKRFSVDDEEIRKIPDKYLEKPKTKVEVNVDGKNMSYSAYKKMCRLAKRQIREDKQKCVTISEAMKILNITRDVFYHAILIKDIEVRMFGTIPMIHRDDLLKLLNTF